MKKGINIVILGVLTVASVILALPFTPLRNSFQGVATNAANQALTSMGVDLNVKFKTARLIARTHQYDIVDFTLENAGSSGRKFSESAYSGMNRSFSDGTYSAFNVNKDGTHAGGGSADLAIASAGKGSKSGSGSQGGGFVSINTKLNSTHTNTGGTTKQNANTDNNGTGGGTHPGVDPLNPLGSLPVGDGIYLLLLLIAGYSGIKKLFFRVL